MAEIHDVLQKLEVTLNSQPNPAVYAAEAAGQSYSKYGVQIGKAFVPVKSAYALVQRLLGKRGANTKSFGSTKAQKFFEDRGFTVEKKPYEYWKAALAGSSWRPLPAQPAFQNGKRYRRQELHAAYGGQQQGGVSTPKDTPVIFLVTGESGHQHGYSDIWHDDGSVSYYGEGQEGDMTWDRGNEAIRDHHQNGRQIHIFKDMGDGWLSYTGEFEVIGYADDVLAPDKKGEMRNAIVFELARCDALNAFVQDANDQIPADTSLEDLYRAAIEKANAQANASHRQADRKPSVKAAYERLRAIAVYVYARAAGVCEACTKAAPFLTDTGRPFLEAHHIHHLSDGGLDRPENVAAVCPNCHRQAHHGQDRQAMNERLALEIARKEAELHHG